MWSVRDEPADRPDVVPLIRAYFAELTVRSFHRETDEAEIDLTLAEFPADGLGAFLVLRADGVPAGHLGVYPTGELTRFYVAPPYRRSLKGVRPLNIGFGSARRFALLRGLTPLWRQGREAGRRG